MVVFDWGGVLLRICRSWPDACERAGVRFDDSLDHQMLHDLSHAYQLGSMSCQTYFDRLADSFDARYTHEELTRIHDAVLIEEYGGVHEIVRSLVDHGRVQTGLLSNTNHRHWLHQLQPEQGGYGRFPTAGLLGIQCASHLEGVAKPDAPFYRTRADTRCRRSTYSENAWPRCPRRPLGCLP